jgi:hypothetical protein
LEEQTRRLFSEPLQNPVERLVHSR